ncbi:MAG: hypothetical protein IJI49_01385 [Bacilli bacterium]|nr:hypothetical protein [Bacilli bacterium]
MNNNYMTYSEVLKKEINKLQDEINIINKINNQTKIKRNTIKGLYTLRHILPFILTTGLTFGAFSAFEGTPFKKDSYIATLEVKKNIDSKGVTKIEQKYKRNHNFEGSLSYIGEWTKQDNGTYTRKIKKYLTNDIEENIIENIVNNVDFNSLDDILGTPIIDKTETRNDLTINQINAKPYMQAIIYREDKNNYITITESNKSNIITATIWIIVNLYTNALVYDAIMKETKGKYKKNFEKRLEKINENYPNTNSSEIVKKLELKKEQYKKYSK